MYRDALELTMRSSQFLQKSLASNVRRNLVSSHRSTWALSAYQRRWNSQTARERSSGSDGAADGKAQGKGDEEPSLKSIGFKMLESAATALASIAVLGYENKTNRYR